MYNAFLPTQMIQSSGFFGPVAQMPDETSSGLECIHESENGHCLLLKGHRNDRIVVYKTLKVEFRDDPVFQRMLRREYEIGASLKHPGICEILSWTTLPEYGDSIEMEWIDGVPLDRWLDSHRGDKTQCRRLLLDLCDALGYLHRKQVVHKDIKPENILVTRLGSYIKIIDFGLSDTDSILTGKDPGGTRSYAAPEVLAGGVAEARSDIYSLGKIMASMDPVFSKIARKCTRTEKEKRYASTEEIRHDLEALNPARRRLAALIPVAIIAISIALALLLLRNDPVEQLFLEASEQVREAANPS